MSSALWLLTILAIPALHYGAPLAIKTVQISRLRRVCREHGLLVLTFDDGPSEAFTPSLLDRLREAGAKATFFLMGKQATRSPEIAHRALLEGHEIGSHSAHHRNAWRTLPLTDTLAAAVGAVEADAIHHTPYFRPPYGRLTLPTMIWAWSTGRRIAWWTINSNDIHGGTKSPDQLAEEVRHANGGVVLLHDFHDGEPADDIRTRRVIELTDALLQTAGDAGLRIVRFGELQGSFSVLAERLGSEEAENKADPGGLLGRRPLGAAQPAETVV